MGIGLCEEAILLVKYFKDYAASKKKIYVEGTDIDPNLVERATRNILHFNLAEYITVRTEDFVLNPVLSDYFMVYTSAAVNDTFNWKLLHFGLQTNATFLFFSDKIRDTFVKKFKKEYFLDFSKAFLARAGGEKGEPRHIHYINMRMTSKNDPNFREDVSEAARERLAQKIEGTVSSGVWGLFDKIQSDYTVVTWSQILGNNGDIYPPIFKTRIQNYDLSCREFTSQEEKKKALVKHFSKEGEKIVNAIFPQEEITSLSSLGSVMSSVGDTTEEAEEMKGNND